MRNRVAAIGTSCLVLAAAWSLTAATMHARNSSGAHPQQPRFPLGDSLPHVQLETPSGESINLHAWLNGRPSVVYIFGVKECAGCSNLPLEFEIIHREVPGITPLLIASGAPADSFATFFKTTKLGASALVDEHRALLHLLRVDKEPIVLLVDSAGRILSVDTRSASQAAQYPMGRILHQLLALTQRPTAKQSADHP